jgi:hypothetical protein
MRRSIAFGVLVCAVVSAAVAYGQGQPSIPACPNSEDKITTFTPGYGKPGQSAVYRLDLTDDAFPEDIANAAVTLFPESGSPVAGPVAISEDETKVILAAPMSGKQFAVHFDWDQDLGTSAACHGNDSYTLPLLPIDAKVGNPFVARLEGTYAVREAPRSYTGKVTRAKWKIKPGCDFFGCSSKLRSNAGLKGQLRLRSTGSYLLLTTYREAASCVVTTIKKNTLTGQVISRTTRTIPHAYRGKQRVSVRVDKEANGRGLRFSGSITNSAVPTEVARAQHCTKTHTWRDHVTGRLLR